MAQLKIDASFYDQDYFEKGHELGISAYDKHSFKLGNDIFKHQADMLNDILKLRGKRVVDIGGARGNLAYYLHRVGVDAYCEDCSVWCWENSHIPLFHHIGNVQDMIYCHPVDAVVTFHALEHLDRPLDAIKNISSVLKKGGIFFGVIPSDGHEHDPSGVAMLTRDDWHKMLTDCNLKERKDLYDKFFWHDLVKAYNWEVYCYERC